MKLYLRTYISRFHPKTLWETIKKHNLWYLFCWLWPVMNINLKLSKIPGSMGSFNASFWTGMLLAMELLLMPMRLSKLQYLCPMDAVERRRYIMGMYRLKNGVPTGILLIWKLLCLPLKPVMLPIIFMEVGTLWMTGAVLQLGSAKSGEVPPKETILPYLGICGIFSVIRLILLGIFEQEVREGEQAIAYLIAAVIVFLWQIIHSLRAWKKFPDIVEELISYETKGII